MLRHSEAKLKYQGDNTIGRDMNKTTINTQGHLCPKPIIMTKEAFEAAMPGDVIEIIFDREQAKNNTIRFLQDNNIPATCTQDGDIFTIYITKETEKITSAISEESCSIIG